MEQGFLCQQVLGDGYTDWTPKLAHIFNNVEFTKSFFASFLTRYFRNYIWLVDLIVVAWSFRPPPTTLFCSIGAITLIQHSFYFWVDIHSPDL
jgi:uncharacterized membrane protein